MIDLISTGKSLNVSDVYLNVKVPHCSFEVPLWKMSIKDLKGLCAQVKSQNKMLMGLICQYNKPLVN